MSAIDPTFGRQIGWAGAYFYGRGKAAVGYALNWSSWTRNKTCHVLRPRFLEPRPVHHVHREVRTKSKQSRWGNPIEPSVTFLAA